MEEAQGYDFDIDDSENDAFIGTKKNKIALEDMDYTAWRQYLVRDQEELALTKLMLDDITPEHDSKLQQLIEDLRNKFEHPINGDNKKVIIFTASRNSLSVRFSCSAAILKADTWAEPHAMPMSTLAQSGAME